MSHLASKKPLVSNSSLPRQHSETATFFGKRKNRQSFHQVVLRILVLPQQMRRRKNIVCAAPGRAAALLLACSFSQLLGPRAIVAASSVPPRVFSSEHTTGPVVKTKSAAEPPRGRTPPVVQNRCRRGTHSTCRSVTPGAPDRRGALSRDDGARSKPAGRRSRTRRPCPGSAWAAALGRETHVS